jgi:iron complex transport system substrate-binding protein
MAVAAFGAYTISNRTQTQLQASSTPAATPTATPTPTSTSPSAPSTSPYSTQQPSETTTPTYPPTPTSTATPSPTATPPTNITLVDATGATVTVSLPVNRVVSLNSGFTELICALGAADKLVGRDELSKYPDYVANVSVVAQNSYQPNIEALLQAQPDLVVADTMLAYNQDALGKIKNAGIPVIIENPSNSTRLDTMIQNLGLALGKSERANELLNYIHYYLNLVYNRVGNLTSSKPLVYIEWYTAWRSFGPGSAGNQLIVEAGGTNIAANVSTAYPTLSAEYVAEKNPDVIIRMISGNLVGNLTGYQATWQEIITRPGLKDVTAVKTGHVYIYDPIITQGIRYPIGLLYFAKWLHPETFADINPAAIHDDFTRKFYGVSIQGVYVFP